MAATNALVHLIALAALGGLGWALVVARSRLEVLRLTCLATPPPRERVSVDWPLRFVQKFAKAGAIPFYGDGATVAGKPCRIKGRVLGRLACQEGIVHFRWHPASGDEQAAGAWLEVVVWNSATAGATWSEALSAALQMPTLVRAIDPAQEAL